ncbi:MAG: type II secretion system secretin GspD [Gammaproteobacteria bacterium]
MMTRKRSNWLRTQLFAPLLVVTTPLAAQPEDEASQLAPPPPPPQTTPAPAPAAPIAPVTPPRAPAPPPRNTPGAATVTPMGQGEVLLNFQAADIQAVVKAVSQMTGRNFLLDPRVKGQITIISAKPVSRYAAYQIFLSALKAQGFTAVDGPGGVVKVLPTGEAKQSANVSQDAPRGGEVITTHVAVLQHISAAQMVPLLRPLMAPTSQLSAYDAANALILTDYADNIRRMLRIIERIDQPVSSDVTVIGLKHASALDLADMITRLAAPPGAVPGAPGQPGAAAAAGDRFTIAPDLRTNSLLIRTDNPGRLNQLRSLIEKLDVPATTGGSTRVVYLRNAEAVKLAEVLRGLLAGEARAQAASVPAAAPGLPAAARPAGGRTADASLIQADESTNALIINASDAVYNNLRAVIEKLDVRRAQVFVEALITEITTEKALELGFQWADAGKAGNGAIAGVQNFPRANPSLGGAIVGAEPPVGAGLNIAFLGPKITLPDGTVVQTLGALARALEQKNIGNILSTPNLMTLDNAEAKIVVARNVPFLTGSFATVGTGTAATATPNPFQTIERKDVGITLKIKPQISEGGVVKLEISQEISSVETAVETTELNRITNKRSIDTKVIVDDGSTVVLGGLIQDQIEESRQQVPLLGRIPLIGALFRYKSDTKRKTNLMVFLRPTIIRTVDDSYRTTADRYDYIRAQTKEKEAERNQILNRFQPAPPPAEPPKTSTDEKLGPPEAPDGSPTVQ